jgi:LmbE family N-acetylglucosaminyl deacetylase
MARYADEGHDVVALYLTRGEAGVTGKSFQEAAAIRTAEAEAACKLL